MKNIIKIENSNNSKICGSVNHIVKTEKGLIELQNLKKGNILFGLTGKTIVICVINYKKK